MDDNVRFNKPGVCGNELRYIESAIAAGTLAGGNCHGSKCEEILAETLGCHAMLTTSCTHSLEMAAMLLDIQEGDEVILPSFTFVSTANAFVLRGATPVFCDIRLDTLNMDEKLLPSLISRHTKAIIPVHYAGVGCEMETIMNLAKSNGIAVVEDNAHGLMGKYRGRWLGTFGCLSTQSFHETKNVSCGEGGALLINDRGFVERAEIIREKGTNRSSFFRGQVAKYSWVDAGSSYVLSEILAAYLHGQLEQLGEIQTRRRIIWQRYHESLADWALRNGITQPFVPADCEQAWHMYYLLLPSLDQRSRFISHLASSGMQAVFHYLPLHASQFAIRYGTGVGDCPVTEQVSDTLVRLPFYTSMSFEVQERVIQRILSFS